MAQAKKPPEEPAKPKKTPRITMGTWIALAVLIPICVLTVNLFRKWADVRSRSQKSDVEFAADVQRNNELRPALEILPVKKFMVCNKTPAETVTVRWVAAAYHDGKEMKVFDSSRCSEWKHVVLVPGDTGILNLNSSQAGCNWSGGVVYFALNYKRESEERENVVNYAGPYRGFDRDCFNIE